MEGLRNMGYVFRGNCEICISAEVDEVVVERDMRSRDRVSLHDDDYRLWSIAALLLLNIPWTRGGRFARVYVHRSASVWRRVAISVITFFFFVIPSFFSRI